MRVRIYGIREHTRALLEDGYTRSAIDKGMISKGSDVMGDVRVAGLVTS